MSQYLIQNARCKGSDSFLVLARLVANDDYSAKLPIVRWAIADSVNFFPSQISVEMAYYYTKR